jgi:CRISPR-associated endonuclease/helicase Cas3
MSKDRVYGHIRSGEPITDEEIESLAAETESGYDVDTLIARRDKRGRPALGSAPASVESVRLDHRAARPAPRARQNRRHTTSEVIREALRRFLKAA